MRAKCLTAFKHLAILSCLIVTGAVVYVVWWLKANPPFTSTNANSDFIEANAKIELPAGASDIQAYTEGLDEISTWIRFTMDADDLPSFLESTLCEEPLSPIDPNSYQKDSRLSWWTPEAAQDLWECRGEGEHTRQLILVDMTSSQSHIVYVYAGTGTR